MSGENSNIEWQTVALIWATYVSWFLAGVYLYPTYPILAFIVLILVVAFHSSLIHEVLHGHPTRNSLINETLITASLNLVLPYRRYKTLHLGHHNDERLTDPFDDPESYYKAFWKYDTLPRLFKFILHLNNMMVGRFILGPLLNIGGLLMCDISATIAGDHKIRFAWIVHLVSAAPILLFIIFVFEMPVWQYLICVVWPAFGLIAIRSYAEHQWHENEDGRTIIVEKSALSFLFLNNNLHVVHHKNPTVAWYNLPQLYRRQKPYWAKLNGNYVFKNYWELLKKYAFVSKEPVAHPTLRKENLLMEKSEPTK